MENDKIKMIRKSLGDDLEEDKRLFSDDELASMLTSYEDINLCLYYLYLQKAGRLITNESYIKSIKAGNEELERLNASDLQAMALKQAEKYKELYDWSKNVDETSCIIY